MIFVEFGQVLRINYLPQLYFVYLVDADRREIVVVPFDDSHASGEAKVPVRPDPYLQRTFALRDIRQLEVVYAPPERGVCAYYGIEAGALLSLHFDFVPPHVSMRVRVVRVEHDMMLFVLADPQLAPQLPPAYSAKRVFAVDFRYRGVRRELAIRDIGLQPAAGMQPDPSPPSAAPPDTEEMGDVRKLNLSQAHLAWANTFVRAWKNAWRGAGADADADADAAGKFAPDVRGMSAVAWLFRHHVLPAWQKIVRAARKKRRPEPGLLEPAALFTPWVRATERTSRTAAAAAAAVLAPAEKDRAAGPWPTAGLVMPPSLRIRNAKVLAREFPTEKELRAVSDGGAPEQFFDAALDDLDYAWVDRIGGAELRSRLSVVEQIEFVAATLKTQTAPRKVEPEQLIAPLARWLVLRKRPVLRGHFARVRSTGAVFMWTGTAWSRPTFFVDGLHFHNVVLGGVGVGVGATTEEEEHPSFFFPSSSPQSATAPAPVVAALKRAHTVRMLRPVLAFMHGVLELSAAASPPNLAPKKGAGGGGGGGGRWLTSSWYVDPATLMVVRAPSSAAPAPAPAPATKEKRDAGSGAGGDGVARFVRLLEEKILFPLCAATGAPSATSGLAALARAWRSFGALDTWCTALQSEPYRGACDCAETVAHAQCVVYHLVYEGPFAPALQAALGSPGVSALAQPGQGMDARLDALFAGTAQFRAAEVHCDPGLQRVWLRLTLLLPPPSASSSAVAVVVALSRDVHTEDKETMQEVDKQAEALAREWCGLSYVNYIQHFNTTRVLDKLALYLRGQMDGWPRSFRAMGLPLLEQVSTTVCCDGGGGGGGEEHAGRWLSDWGSRAYLVLRAVAREVQRGRERRATRRRRVARVLAAAETEAHADSSWAPARTMEDWWRSGVRRIHEAAAAVAAAASSASTADAGCLSRAVSGDERWGPGAAASEAARTEWRRAVRTFLLLLLVAGVERATATATATRVAVASSSSSSTGDE